jgi:hypothetical protein
MSADRTNPDPLLLIAQAIAELINSRPRTPTVEEVSSVYRDGYLAALARRGIIPPEQCREIVEGLDGGCFTRRAAGVLALVNSMPRSPTVEEISEALRAATTVNADAPVYDTLSEKDEQEDDNDDDDEEEEEELTKERDVHPEDCECYDCFQSQVAEAPDFCAALHVWSAKRLDKRLREKYPDMTPEQRRAFIEEHQAGHPISVLIA